METRTQETRTRDTYRVQLVPIKLRNTVNSSHFFKISASSARILAALQCHLVGLRCEMSLSVGLSW